MSEIGIAEYFGIGEAIGIIATLFVILYFSRKQMQALLLVALVVRRKKLNQESAENSPCYNNKYN